MITGVKQTKMERAKALYIQNPNLARKDLANLFEKELGMTSSSARTHVSLCAKELNNQLGKPFQTRSIKKELKRDMAYELFVKNVKGVDRKNMIDIFVDKLGMTRNSAATHASKCAQMWKRSNPNNPHDAV